MDLAPAVVELKDPGSELCDVLADEGNAEALAGMISVTSPPCCPVLMSSFRKPPNPGSGRMTTW